MGRTTSSSTKRKSSKRKSSKLSHEAARRGKKSRKNRSKKARRRHDSDSPYSDDDSRSSASISSSSSEENYLSTSSDDYVSRKGRSRTRTDAKSRSKKTRRRSSSPERSKDSRSLKKRKRSKKDVNSRPRKSRMTKRKRDVSSSSASSDSHSCFSCEESSRSSEESEPERHREKSRRSKRSKGDTVKERKMTRKSRSKSPSYSSGSRYDQHCRSISPDMEHNVVENVPRRLRSVISVVERQCDETHVKSEKDPYKEEITCDHDDYPSPRSNDSNDGINRREPACISHVAADKRQGESATREDVTLPNHRTNEGTEDDMDFNGQHTTAASDGLTATISAKENETEASDKLASSGDTDLEYILRQKALENLRRFRGGKKMNTKTTTSRREEKEEDPSSSNKLYAASDDHEKPDPSNEHPQPIDVGKSSDSVLKRDLAPDAEVAKDISGGESFENNPETRKQNYIHQPLSWNSKEAKDSTSSPVNEKPGSRLSASGQGSFSSRSTVKQEATAELAPSSSNLSVTKITVSNTAATPLPPHSEINQATGLETADDSSSTGKEITNPGTESASTEHGSKDQQKDEPKDGSQFEKKTMSVMRGGEMVQVSYKVYIPKKAPALARRHLKR